MVGEQFDAEGFEFHKHASKTQFKEWSMVAVRDYFSPNNDCFVFPPINHENLHLPSPPNQQRHDLLSSSPSSPSLSSSSSSYLSSFSPSHSDESGPVLPLPSDTQVRKPSEFATWIKNGVQLLRSKLSALASSVVFGKVWCFASGAGMATLLFVLWSFYQRARKRRYRSNFKLIIKEKDAKINILLHQIAQLNEVLVARHKALASRLAN